MEGKEKSKTNKKKEKSIKKLVTKFRIRIIGQHKDFDNQEDARKFARKVLENEAVYFLECVEIKVEEKLNDN